MAAAGWSDDDFWRPYARFFRMDPRRRGDVVLDALLDMVEPGMTALDVGGGAGRLALPLALRCRHVEVVEPSGSMAAELRAAADEAGIGNYSVVRSAWEAADVEPADLALCAHVLYGVADIEPFIRKLEAHVRSLVVVLAFMESPMTRVSVFWEAVHGERRVDMPALPELMGALWEMGIRADLRMMPPAPPDMFEDMETALGQLRNRLYVRAGTTQDGRLRDAMGELLVAADEGVAVRGVRDTQQGYIFWRPEGRRQV